LWLLTVSIVVEEVATADLFSTNALDVEDVNRTDLDVVGSKLVGEEDRKKPLLVMMHQLLMLMVPQLRSMALLLMMLMVLPQPQRPLVTMMIMKQVVPMTLMVPQLKSMVPLLMILMVLQLRNMVLPLMMLMVLPQKDLLTMMTTPLEMFL